MPSSNSPRTRKHSGGRRKGTSGTRDALLKAALELFAERGYEGASLRAITSRAGVDVAMVSHFFGDKQGLFDESVQARARNNLEFLSELDPDQTPAMQLLQAYFAVWENPETALTVRALFRAALESDEHRMRLQEMIGSRLFEVIAKRTNRNPATDKPDPEVAIEVGLRTQFLAAHLLGIGIARYILKFSPIADVPLDVLIPRLEPVITAYLSTPPRDPTNN